jgi:ABC-type branched-subunit amino acid transport system substrate-binding protein
MTRLRITSTAVAASIVLGLCAAPPASAAGKYDTGASDTEIKIGNTFPYSGPASGTSVIARLMSAYFQSVNDQGGVNGRKINFISLDDAYSPPKTVEQTRRLVEQDGVLLMFGTLGTPTNMSVRAYLNSRKVPQLFVTTGSNTLIDPKKFPYTMGYQPSYRTEANIFARYLLTEHPDAKIGILYQDDDFGSDHLDPFLQALGPKAAKMVVAKATYQITDPSVASQIITLRGAGADALYLIVSGRSAPLAVSAVHDQAGWNPVVLMASVATAKSVIGPAGDAALTGVISDNYEKDPTDPTWADDPAVKSYLEFLKKYVSSADYASDAASPTGYDTAALLVELLKRCGDDLTRANVMHQAESLHDVKVPLLLPGSTVNTGPDQFFPLKVEQLERYDGKRWVLFGKPVEG